jgi:hypothetical protein
MTPAEIVAYLQIFVIIAFGLFLMRKMDEEDSKRKIQKKLQKRKPPYLRRA